jgi:hypothetical protein
LKFRVSFSYNDGSSLLSLHVSKMNQATTTSNSLQAIHKLPIELVAKIVQPMDFGSLCVLREVNAIWLAATGDELCMRFHSLLGKFLPVAQVGRFLRIASRSGFCLTGLFSTSLVMYWEAQLSGFDNERLDIVVDGDDNKLCAALQEAGYEGFEVDEDHERVDIENIWPPNLVHSVKVAHHQVSCRFQDEYSG